MTQDDKLSVLVVDDDPDALALMAKAVRDAGYDVATASDGHEALQRILADGHPLVCTDWMMPKMNGGDLCRAIKEHEGIPYAFVVVITAYHNEDRVVEALDAGADDYLAKPFKARELAARLRAGERIVRLQQDVGRRRRELHRVNAEMDIAYAKLGEANEKLLEMATTDELTGLTNRRDGMRRLAEAWACSDRTAEPLSCIMLDIDHFKKINDTYGHAAGDAVLVAIAQTLRSVVRRDERICRIGGEEFLLLCTNTSSEQACVAGERMRQAVEAWSSFSDVGDVCVTVSLGVAQRTDAFATPDDLLHAADQALYTAKQNGRNRVECATCERTARPLEVS